MTAGSSIESRPRAETVGVAWPRSGRWAPLALLAATLALLAGAAIAGAAPLDASSYRARADAVCAGANARMERVPVPRSEQGIRAWMAEAVPVYTRSVARLRGLAPPRALRARHRAWTGVLAQRVRLVRRLQLDIAGGAPAAAAVQAAAPRLERLRLKARARARQLGLRACAGRPR